MLLTFGRFNGSMDSALAPFALPLPLGLGCSRLGSVLGPDERTASALIKTALDLGMSFFDTASIYGQGDSERILGRVLGNRRDCIVCSKVGQRLPVPNPALMPVKRLARILAGRSHTIRRAVSNARAQPMPRNWCPQYLADAVDGSLRRLGRDQVDIMLLHGPPVEVLVEGEAIDALEAARRVGKVGIIGVSADDAASAQAALADERVRVLQIPLRPGETEFEGLIGTAVQKGVLVVAREVLGGPLAISGQVPAKRFAASRFAELCERKDLAVTLVGTTKESHLRAAADQLFGSHVRVDPEPARPDVAEARELSLRLA